MRRGGREEPTTMETLGLVGERVAGSGVHDIRSDVDVMELPVVVGQR